MKLDADEKELVDSVERGEWKSAKGGKRERVCILFSDIRNFTTRSEKMPPEVLIEMLNRYFTEMTQSVHERGGRVLQGRLLPSPGAGHRHWFRTDPPWWKRALGLPGPSAAEVVRRCADMLPDVEYGCISGQLPPLAAIARNFMVRFCHLRRTLRRLIKRSKILVACLDSEALRSS